MGFTIWTNGSFAPEATRRLHAGTQGHRLIVSPAATAAVLAAGSEDPALEEADIAFGQPDVAHAARCPRLRWVEVTSAGYARYDNEAFRTALERRGAAFTNTSSVFADPCAQHALAMMLALARELPASWRDQSGDRAWNYERRRYESRLLTGQTVLLLGYGAIGRRLAELLQPFGVKLYAVRRATRSERGVHIIPEEKLTSVLAEADHIVNVLPDNESTRQYVNARRLSAVRPGARFYNVGRGSTVDEAALLQALESGRLGGAYLDVFASEPLPPEHPFWTARNCYITPHTAGGREDQDEAVVGHFLNNLATFTKRESLVDRVF